MKCERCSAKTKTPDELFDYCATCGRNQCPDCMEKGCCGAVPAVSGQQEDYGDDEDVEEPTQ